MQHAQLHPSSQRGVTLIELLVVVSIVAILAAFAAPSFMDFQDRSALRAAANEIQSVIESARFESVARDRQVTVAFRRESAAVWCVGAREGAAACDCRELNVAAATFCDLDRYPAFNPAGNAIATQAPPLVKRVEVFEAASFGGESNFTFDPKLGVLTDPARFGAIGLSNSVNSPVAYQVRVQVTPLGITNSCDLVYAGRPVSGLQPC